MIQVENIHKSFGDNKVLKGISTSFEKGKTSLIIGQSGSGKTVFLKCLLGLFGLDSGNILYDKDNYAKPDFKKEKKNQRKNGYGLSGQCFI
jgi:phospholipid/cholesterol/gamma-HCH transport system ATP-binding protein